LRIQKGKRAWQQEEEEQGIRTGSRKIPKSRQRNKRTERRNNCRQRGSGSKKGNQINDPETSSTISIKP
jgi:hypothetical protein